MNKVTYYKLDSKGAIRVWSIEIVDDTLEITHGQLDGALQTQIENVEENSVRNLEEQLLSRFQSRCNKQLDRGYYTTIEDAKKGRGSNILGYPKPMLAAKFKDVENFDPENYLAQRKYDGNRCLVTNDDGKLIAYSRNGKRMLGLDHILDELDIPEGVTLDGELYCHGVPLNRIRSWVSRQQEETTFLTYMVYDVVNTHCYSHRLDLIKSIVDGNEHSQAVETWSVNKSSIKEQMKKARDENYEGLILRELGQPYHSKRSKALVKVKAWEDEEFVVVKITPSADGWGVLHCITEKGKAFKVTAPGGVEEKTKVLNEKDKYIGHKVNVEYANLTEYGVPFHPVATEWRIKEHE